MYRNRAMKKEKILVIRFSSLGDLVLILPLLRQLRAGFPMGEIHLATKKRYAPLFASNNDIDHIHTLDSNDLRGLFGLYRRLFREKYNIVIDAHNVIRSNLLSFVLPVRKKIRIKKNQARKIALIKKKRNLFKKILPMWKRYLELSTGLGISPSENETRLLLPDHATIKIGVMIESAGLSGLPLVAIAPGARWETKRWPEERFRDLIPVLVAHGFGIILIGDRSESELSSRIGGSGKRVLNTAGRLSLLETAAILDRCLFLITNDSAPLHLAEAVGTPVIAFFGPTVEEFGFFPHLAKSIPLQVNLDCRPCSRNGSRACPFGTRECLESITVGEVMSAVGIISGKDLVRENEKGTTR